MYIGPIILLISDSSRAEPRISGGKISSPAVELVRSLDAADQISSVQLIFDGGFLDERPGNCGHWHLREHVVTRLIDRVLRSAPSENSFNLNGVTSFDHSVVSINIFGGSSGIAEVMTAINAVIKSHDAGMDSIVREESTLVGLEQQNHPHMPWSLAPLFASTPAALRPAVFGNCFVRRSGDFGRFNFGTLSQIIIVSAAPSIEISKIPLDVVTHGSAHIPAKLIAASRGSHSFFYSEFSKPGALIDPIIGTVAFWYGAAAIEGHPGAVGFVPVGGVGVQVQLRNWRATESRLLQILNQLRKGEYRSEFAVGLSSARGLLCRIRVLICTES